MTGLSNPRIAAHHLDESSDRLASSRHTSGNSEPLHSGKQCCSRQPELRRGSVWPTDNPIGCVKCCSNMRTLGIDHRLDAPGFSSG